MHIGILTAPLRDKSFEEIAAFAGEHGFGALEVACGPGSKVLDTANLDTRRAEEIQQILQKNKLRISSLAAYANSTPEKPEDREKAAQNLRYAVDAAQKLGVDVVCTLAGLPYAGKSRYQLIESDAKAFFTPICEYAGEKGIKIALE